jgi:succinate dehydrogenase / fumarate reductase flavoprotein subunit
MNHPVLEHDVLVIGAGGVQRPRSVGAGVKVGVITKSFSRAHTVMAGGMAAAMANVDDRDNWRALRRHDARRPAPNNGAWPSCTRSSRPIAKELEAWGAVFDRTGDGCICSATSAAIAIRAAHVGDRTGLR